MIIHVLCIYVYINWNLQLGSTLIFLNCVVFDSVFFVYVGMHAV